MREEAVEELNRPKAPSTWPARRGPHSASIRALPCCASAPLWNFHTTHPTPAAGHGVSHQPLYRTITTCRRAAQPQHCAQSVHNTASPPAYPLITHLTTAAWHDLLMSTTPPAPPSAATPDWTTAFAPNNPAVAVVAAAAAAVANTTIEGISEPLVLAGAWGGAVIA